MYRNLQSEILALLASQDSLGAPSLAKMLNVSRATILRALNRLASQGAVLRQGAGPAVRYRRAPVDDAPPAPEDVVATAPSGVSLIFSADAQRLHQALSAPLATRTPVSYRRAFVDGYVPNHSVLLPTLVADRLFDEGRAPDRQPAGTYARKVLEQLLVDLSWHSSRLEGNPLTLLDTKALFARGRGADDSDATMLLNHKDAIEFLVYAVPEQGITVPVIRNLHSVLMQGLLAEPTAVGAIRRKLVDIHHSVYLPSQVPSLLEEMLGVIVEKARVVKNPIEAAFFLWVQLAYLQPFEDGNKRTSRLAANLPLLLTNCAPLSFLDVSVADYSYAMLGVYERNDVTIAAELFEWTYRRCIDKYRAVRESLGMPDPLRARYRELLGEVVRDVVVGARLSDVLRNVRVEARDRDAFEAMARQELDALEPWNCARFRLGISVVERWIAHGRPA
jgi:Fic family protein